jgi:hypothetical protein
MIMNAMNDLIKTGKGILEQIKELHKITIKEGRLDEQWFLNFQDELNKLSLDPDRND